jgi:antiphage defense system Thoeris ThsB-like protein
MTKRVFFSFHYQDVIDLRANVVRNHWLTKPDREAAGFFDASLWESAKRTSSFALKRLIDSGLENTSVTCVLIGSQTFERPWVRYEILKSFKRGNLLLGVNINSIKGRDQQTKVKGLNPFEYAGITFSDDGKLATLWEKVNNEWNEYSEIDGRCSYSVDVAPEYRGKGFNFAHWYSTYDWVLDGGYNSFSSWVGC